MHIAYENFLLLVERVSFDQNQYIYLIMRWFLEKKKEKKRDVKHNSARIFCPVNRLK